jgi:hypothetical protein
MPRALRANAAPGLPDDVQRQLARQAKPAALARVVEAGQTLSIALRPTMDIRSARTGKAREAMIHPFVPYSPGQFALSRPRLRARINLPAQEDGATLIEATGSAGSSPRRPTRHPARVSAPIEMVASSRSFGALATSPNQRVRSRPILDRDYREGTPRCQADS